MGRKTEFFITAVHPRADAIEVRRTFGCIGSRIPFHRFRRANICIRMLPIYNSCPRACFLATQTWQRWYLFSLDCREVVDVAVDSPALFLCGSLLPGGDGLLRVVHLNVA